MTNAIPALLLIVFLAHLIGFAVLGFRRRQWYYLALVITFGLLSAAFAAQLFAPEARLANVPVHWLLRITAWAAAAISVSWTALRVLGRKRGKV